MGRPRVLTSPEATGFVRQRGGKAFIWVKPVGAGVDGWLKVTTEMPADGSIRFSRHEVGGCDVFVDRSLPDVDEVRLELRRLPREHLVVKGYPRYPDGAAGGP